MTESSKAVALVDKSEVVELAFGSITPRRDLDKYLKDTNVLNQFTEKHVKKWQLKTTDWEYYREAFSYQGFNQNLVYAHLLAKIAQNSITDDVFHEDLTALLLLHHVKGSVNPQNFQKMSTEGQRIVKSLYPRWGIQMRVLKGQQQTVTLPRLAAAFPLQLAAVSSTFPHNYAGLYDSGKLPDAMQNSTFASLIPLNENVTYLLLTAYTCYTADQSMVLDGKMRGRGGTVRREDYFAKQINYVNASHTSTILSQVKEYLQCSL